MHRRDESINLVGLLMWIGNTMFYFMFLVGCVWLAMNLFWLASSIVQSVLE